MTHNMTVEEKIRDILQKMFGRGVSDTDSLIEDLEVDELDYTGIACELEHRFKIEVSDQQFLQLKSFTKVGEIVGFATQIIMH